MPTPLWRGSTALTEAPDSPQWSFGDQIKLIRKFSGPHATCLSSAPLKGAIGAGPAVGMQVAQSVVSRSRGGIGVLSIEYETAIGTIPEQGATLPYDEAELSGDEVEEQLKDHPNYSDLTVSQHANINTVLNTPWDSAENQAAYIAIAADAVALQLLAKLQRGFTHYAVASPVYQLTLYFWDRPGNLSAGGFRQDPPNTPILPPGGLDWLRKPDRLSHNGTHWVLVRRWQGYVTLDADIYP